MLLHRGENLPIVSKIPIDHWEISGGPKFCLQPILQLGLLPQGLSFDGKKRGWTADKSVVLVWAQKCCVSFDNGTILDFNEVA